jgi:hypothetical protein
MKPREPRHKVHIPARMRSGAAWMDVLIKNMSHRGLMAECGDPPTRGTYVEIRRGRQIVVGLIVWSRNGQFGLRTQDRIDMQAIVSEPRLTRRPDAPAGNGNDRRLDARRSATPPAVRAERNRMIGKAAQFGLMVVVGSGAAIFAAAQVYSVLSSPLRAASAAMGGEVPPSAKAQ